MVIGSDYALDYIKTDPTVDHFKLSMWQNINIGIFI